MDENPAPDATHDAVGSPPVSSRWRTASGAAMVLVVTVAAIGAIYRERGAFVDALRDFGLGPAVLAFLFACAGTALTFPIWQTVLRGFGAAMSTIPAARLFYVSQLGKYLPGAVWPILLQTEGARVRRIPARIILVGNLTTLVISCGVGLALGSLLLPAQGTEVFRRYWWTLLALSVLVLLLRPRTLALVVNTVFRFFGRPMLAQPLSGHALARAAGWSCGAWVCLGAHVAVLCAALGAGGFREFLVCLGGVGLAISAGVLFVPAPAGSGAREVILLLALMAIVPRGEALAVVVTSRVLTLGADLSLAAIAVLLTRGQRPT